MATPIRPFLSPDELEILIAHYEQVAREAEYFMKEERAEAAQKRADELKKHRSISG